jgi:putative addiction module component (TIGR02574 family)
LDSNIELWRMTLLADLRRKQQDRLVSKAEILEELVRLTPEERREIRARLNELEGMTSDEWNDNGALTDKEKRLIESRVAEHESDPQSAVAWEEFEARTKKRIG